MDPSSSAAESAGEPSGQAPVSSSLPFADAGSFSSAHNSPSGASEGGAPFIDPSAAVPPLPFANASIAGLASPPPESATQLRPPSAVPTSFAEGQMPFPMQTESCLGQKRHMDARMLGKFRNIKALKTSKQSRPQPLALQPRKGILRVMQEREEQEQEQEASRASTPSVSSQSRSKRRRQVSTQPLHRPPGQSVRSRSATLDPDESQSESASFRHEFTGSDDSEDGIETETEADYVEAPPPAPAVPAAPPAPRAPPAPSAPVAPPVPPAPAAPFSFNFEPPRPSVLEAAPAYVDPAGWPNQGYGQQGVNNMFAQANEGFPDEDLVMHDEAGEVYSMDGMDVDPRNFASLPQYVLVPPGYGQPGAHHANPQPPQGAYHQPPQQQPAQQPYHGPYYDGRPQPTGHVQAGLYNGFQHPQNPRQAHSQQPAPRHMHSQQGPVYSNGSQVIAHQQPGPYMPPPTNQASRRPSQQPHPLQGAQRAGPSQGQYREDATYAVHQRSQPYGPAPTHLQQHSQYRHQPPPRQGPPPPAPPGAPAYQQPQASQVLFVQEDPAAPKEPKKKRGSRQTQAAPSPLPLQPPPVGLSSGLPPATSQRAPQPAGSSQVPPPFQGAPPAASSSGTSTQAGKKSAASGTLTRKERHYVRPAAPAAFIPTPSGSSSRAAEKSPARPRPRVNPKVHDRMLEVIEELEDEGAKAALLNILFPDADDDPMSEDEMDLDPSPDVKSEQFVPVAMMLDKFEDVAGFVRDQATKSQKFQHSIESKLTQMQRDFEQLKDHQTQPRQVLEARRLAKSPRKPRSKQAQLEADLPRDFHTWPAERRERYRREQKNHLDLLAHNVRKHFKFRLGFNDWPQLVDRHPPLTKEQIQQFEKPGVTIYDIFPDKKFHIDFEQNWANFRFNVVARDEFIEDFINCVGSGWYPTPAVPKKYVVEYYVGQALDTWMATCRKEYRAVKNPPDPVKAAERAEQVARDGRRGTLRQSRIAVCSRREWYQFDLLWSLLANSHMSGDESDRDERGNKRHPPVWKTIRAPWPSSAFRRFMRKLDVHYNNDWASPKVFGKTGKTGGNPPRVRVKGTKVEEGSVPVGIWRNCYSKKWLAKQKPSEIRRLRIIDSDFDFTLPEEPSGYMDDITDSSEDEVEEMMDGDS